MTYLNKIASHNTNNINNTTTPHTVISKLFHSSYRHNIIRPYILLVYFNHSELPFPSTSYEKRGYI